MIKRQSNTAPATFRQSSLPKPRHAAAPNVRWKSLWRPEQFIAIPAGKLHLGSEDGPAHTRPVRYDIGISAFAIAQTPTTVGQYSQFLRATDRPALTELLNCRENRHGDEYPVVGTLHLERLAFCEWAGVSLMTAAQYEYVAKGPKGINEYGIDHLGEAILWENSDDSTFPVSGALALRRGISWPGGAVIDMTGNVFQATADCYQANWYSYLRDGAQDPCNRLPADVLKYEMIELRGASFQDHRERVSPARRYYATSDNRDRAVGFRCVLA